MLSDDFVEKITKLPKRLWEQLNNCPTEGLGVHYWLFSTALQLHQWFSEEEIIEILQDKLSCVRPQREILGRRRRFWENCEGRGDDSPKLMASGRLWGNP
jgi:hypothetical protein